MVADIGDDPALLTGAAFLAAAQRTPSDPKVAMLKGAGQPPRPLCAAKMIVLIMVPHRWPHPGVSILELTLVVAMRQLRDQRSLPHFNFAMVYEEYRGFMAQQPQQSVDLFSKPVAMKVWMGAGAGAGAGVWTRTMGRGGNEQGNAHLVDGCRLTPYIPTRPTVPNTQPLCQKPNLIRRLSS